MQRLSCFLLAILLTGCGTPEPQTLVLFEDAVFYDGYAAAVDEPSPAGTVRHGNTVVAYPLSEADLDAVQDTLWLDLTLGARCDNYDRIGSIDLVFAPGGDDYDPAAVERVELGRFITPFMNMNRDPSEVPYVFDIGWVAPVLRDRAWKDHAPWLEVRVFGTTGAGQTQVSGCSGRFDTFTASVALYTDSSSPPSRLGRLVPLTTRTAFNNYAEGASDVVGTTRKTLPFTLDERARDARLVLITSNHGANAGGEEYNRREHFVTVDGVPVLDYTPGGESCEPFREYNTQANGIYSGRPRSDEEWATFSNWCPGDVIPTRVADLGELEAGDHTFVIDVPDAVFRDQQGNIPLSAVVLTR